MQKLRLLVEERQRSKQTEIRWQHRYNDNLIRIKYLNEDSYVIFEFDLIYLLNINFITWSGFDTSHDFHEKIVWIEKDNYWRYKSSCDSKQEDVIDQSTCLIYISSFDLIGSYNWNNYRVDHLCDDRFYSQTGLSISSCIVFFIESQKLDDY